MDKSIYYGKQGWDKIVNKKVEFIIYDFLVFIRLFSHSSWWDGDEFTVEWNKFDDDVIDVSFHWMYSNVEDYGTIDGILRCFKCWDLIAGLLCSKQKLWTWGILNWDLDFQQRGTKWKVQSLWRIDL